MKVGRRGEGTIVGFWLCKMVAGEKMRVVRRDLKIQWCKLLIDLVSSRQIKLRLTSYC